MKFEFKLLCIKDTKSLHSFSNKGNGEVTKGLIYEIDNTTIYEDKDQSSTDEVYQGTWEDYTSQSKGVWISDTFYPAESFIEISKHRELKLESILNG